MQRPRKMKRLPSAVRRRKARRLRREVTVIFRVNETELRLLCGAAERECPGESIHEYARRMTLACARSHVAKEAARA